MSPPESSNPEPYSTAKAKDEDSKIAIMKMTKDLKEDMNTYLSKVCENISSRRKYWRHFKTLK